MGKRRRKRAGFWLKGICLILLVPVFITTLMQRMRLENLIYGKEGAQEVLNTIDSVEGMEREVREHQENKKDILSGQAINNIIWKEKKKRMKAIEPFPSFL